MLKYFFHKFSLKTGLMGNSKFGLILLCESQKVLKQILGGRFFLFVFIFFFFKEKAVEYIKR